VINIKTVATAAILVMLFFQLIAARPARISQVPNGSVNNCLTCHTVASPAPGNGPRNDFGSMIESRFLTVQGATGEVLWNAFLASLDADGDGISNGVELQDGFGVWRIGDPAPGNSALVTLPGDEADDPQVTLTLQFSGMTPHIGQQLEIRLIDKTTGKEAGREEVSSIPGASFNVNMSDLLVGRSYWIDFYADLNMNSLYDPPPTDHAWRLELDNVTGDTNVPFVHNTNFVDIDWVYKLTVRFSAMDPHLGQLLELRVLEQTTGQEIGRTRVEFISQPDFDVVVPGIRLGMNYDVEFYADLNGNFLYDAPPADHAWRLSASAVSGDERLDFAHAPPFTDISWDYLFTMNFSGMTPHLGQLFEFRVVDEATSQEVGRVLLDSILVPDYVISVPGILPGNNYRADFYADHNGNGGYDPPPVDHAWRILFTDSTGNVAENFAHNTNFININWPTGITVAPQNGIPQDYNLSQNYPNPFNPVTRINFSVAEASMVTLEIYDVLGRTIRVLISRHMAPAVYEVTWDGKDQYGSPMASGVYVYRLKAGNFQQIRRMLLVK
jgi:hypothetical protein